MLNPGQILDIKYEVIKVLGQGGMGTVYLCKNSRLGNFWAVKEVNSKWKNQIDFLAEPNMLKNLSHIGIVRIVDIFYEDDNLYIVEDYIEGKTLKDQVNAIGPLSSELVEDISLQLCSILDYLHSFNPPIVYRDLKPSNIMIKPNNKVVLIDFGIARIYKESQVGDTTILGSKGYIAPEQLVNIQSNIQTDIYSLGATMFFMLTGKSISLPTELIDEKNYPEHLTKSLVKVIQKASAIEPESRYSDVKLMLSDLNAIIADGEKTVFRNSYESAAEATIERGFVAAKMPIIADGECENTILMNSRESVGKVTPKRVFVAAKTPTKRTKLIIIAVLACIIALIFFFFLMSKATPKTAEVTEPKVQPTKEVVEKDTSVNGVLDIRNPVILNSGPAPGPGKGKGKDKNKDVKSFVLNPAASISNSKLSISLTDIEVIDNEVIVTLSIQNTANAALKLDLSQTYLVNGENQSAKGYNPNSSSLLSISQSSSKQELKLYFNDFHFEGSPYILKTVLNSTANKNISLYVNINNPN
ncbi:MAG: protein kinase [Desulfosporosinus sp.]|nr:protein kinase [Desulfosporosinus sp.]